jgi:hypothetical protein
MLYGSAHTNGLYTVPTGSGTQFADGCNAIADLGLSVLKVYCTCDYLTNYPLEAAFSATPTSVTQLAQTTEFATQLARSEFPTVVLTVFTFANGSTNWWRVDPSNTRMAAEYAEIKALAVHLLTTYSGTGKRFIIQNWEGDWAFGDSFTPSVSIDRKMVDFYAAFLGTRQRAVEDARRETAHSGVTVLNAIELNRVVDAKAHGERRRILRDISKRVQPDVISYSAYDSTIVDQGGWGANQAAWEAATRPVFKSALRSIKAAFPGAILQIGEFGFPEHEPPTDQDIAAMVQLVSDVAEEEGVEVFIYWQVFDNEVGGGGPGTYRGFWLVEPDGSTSIAGAKMSALAGGA